MFSRQTGKRRLHHPRLGLAVTELAIGLPVLLVVVMGTMEMCTMIRLKQKLKTVAYEGARVGVLPEAKSSNVAWQCETLCTDQSVHDVTVTTSPSDPTTLMPGDWFEVQVDAPFASNSLTGAWMLSSFDLSESVSLQKP